MADKLDVDSLEISSSPADSDSVGSNQNSSTWKLQKRIQLISRRYDFSDYDDMRDFLDALEELSKKEEYYPDLTFSRTHVNVSIQARDEKLSQLDYDFSVKVDLLSAKAEPVEQK